jgi:hypothetical protein
MTRACWAAARPKGGLDSVKPGALDTVVCDVGGVVIRFETCVAQQIKRIRLEPTGLMP